MMSGGLLPTKKVVDYEEQNCNIKAIREHLLASTERETLRV